MSTSFPTSLDSLTNPLATDKLNSPSHAGQHSDANDALEALEAKVGVDSSAVATSLDYKVTSASSSNPGHKHTSAAVTDASATPATSKIPISKSTGTDYLDAWISDASTTVKGKAVFPSTDFAVSSGSVTVVAASDTVAGKVKLATIAETTTGTDAARAVTPDGLAGSDYGKKVVGMQLFDAAIDTAVGDGKAFFRIPSSLNGYNLIGVAASVYTAGTTNTTDVQIRNVTDSVDMLSTKITIDSAEVDTSTAATAAVIDTTKDDVATGDRIAIDVDAVSTTPAKGLYVELIFQLP